MKVLGLVWLGTRTDSFQEMATFLESTMGLTLAASVDGYREYKLPNADVVELFGPDDAEKRHFTTGPVAGFLVSDIAAALDELRDAGVETIGELHRSGSASSRRKQARAQLPSPMDSVARAPSPTAS